MVAAWVVFVALVFVSAYQHQGQLLLTDEPDQIAATNASMIVCNVRPVWDIPKAERAGKVVHT